MNKRGAPPRAYDTPRGVFLGLIPAAKANGITLRQIRYRLITEPENWWVLPDTVVYKPLSGGGTVRVDLRTGDVVE